MQRQTIYQFWSQVVAQHGDRPALICPRERNLRWTFQQMDNEVNRLARGRPRDSSARRLLKILEASKRLGSAKVIGKLPFVACSHLKTSARVGAWIGNSSHHAALQFATARIGAILTSLNPAYRLPELLAALNLVDCKALFVVSRLDLRHTSN
jgi:acyl-CoA synthetase (AMP-forming)/AMP-acid ligase II